MKFLKNHIPCFIVALLLLTGVGYYYYMSCIREQNNYFYFNVPGVEDNDLPYPSKVDPLQRYNYTIEGKTDNNCIPFNCFNTPYSVDIDSNISGEEEISINIVDDIIPHGDVQLTAYMNRNYNNGKNGGYDWLFRNIKDNLENADITIGNLETVVDDQISYTGTIKGFNAPSILIGALKDTGFDILLTANNHAMDKGADAYQQTVNNVQRYNIIPLGYMNDRNKYKTDNGIEFKNGIASYKNFNIGMLNYTFKSNKIPDNLKGMNFCPPGDLSIIEQRVKELKGSGAEYIILFLHWGNEYYFVPDTTQKQIALKLFDSGIDSIIGGHSHYIQPMELITSNESKQKYIAYSLGNLISHQQGGCKYGLFLQLALNKDSKGLVQLKEVRPLITKTATNIEEYVYEGNAYIFLSFQLVMSTIKEFRTYTKR